MASVRGLIWRAAGIDVFLGVAEIGSISFLGRKEVSNMLRMNSRVNSRPNPKREMRRRARVVMTTDDAHDRASQ